MVTQAELKRLFDYREDGALVRLVKAGGPAGQVGRAIGSIAHGGAERPDKKYLTTKISGKHHCVHRLIYMWHHGVWPEQIDHINRNSLDNRIENLRAANSCTNMQNRKLFKNNTSGVRGVSWDKKLERWAVYVYSDKKCRFFKTFEDFEFAELVSIEIREKYHGVFTPQQV